jgi:hypothetical protein
MFDGKGTEICDKLTVPERGEKGNMQRAERNSM